MKTVVLIIFALVSNPVFSWELFHPKDYSSCVDKYVKNLKSTRAAYIVNSTCKMEFEEKLTSAQFMDYYSCVRDGLKDVSVDSAAVILFNSCKEKYPEVSLYYMMKNSNLR